MFVQCHHFDITVGCSFLCMANFGSSKQLMSFIFACWRISWSVKSANINEVQKFPHLIILCTVISYKLLYVYGANLKMQMICFHQCSCKKKKKKWNEMHTILFQTKNCGHNWFCANEVPLYLIQLNSIQFYRISKNGLLLLTFLVYQYCLKMWYLRSLERAGCIQKQTILERQNGLVLSNTRVPVPVSGTWSILFPNGGLILYELQNHSDFVLTRFHYDFIGSQKAGLTSCELQNHNWFCANEVPL